MKKYVKPDLYYENFDLTEFIASCPTRKVTLDGVTMFQGRLVIDEVDVGNRDGLWFGASESCQDPVEAYCYTNASTLVTQANLTALFNS